MHIAKAYAIKPAAPAVPTAPTAPTSKPAATDALIAGRVDKPVEFNATSAPATTGNVFQMYNRAADRIEAAVAVQMGRQLDVQG